MTKCPMCGYNEAPVGQQVSNAMSNYTLVSNPKVVVTFNSTKEKLFFPATEDGTKPDMTYVRSDLYESYKAGEMKEVAKVVEAPTPVVPPTQTLISSSVPLQTPIAAPAQFTELPKEVAAPVPEPPKTGGFPTQPPTTPK